MYSGFYAYLRVAVLGRIWVIIRKTTKSQYNPTTVTYGHPEISVSTFTSLSNMSQNTELESYKYPDIIYHILSSNTSFPRVAVSCRIWVRLRLLQFSQYNPNTVTYGHPKKCIKSKKNRGLKLLFFHMRLESLTKKILF